MTRHTIIFVAGLLVLAAMLVIALLPPKNIPPAITRPSTVAMTYLGQEFQVSATHHAPSEEEALKIEKAMMSAHPPQHLKTFDDLISFSRILEFPGCGSSTGGFPTDCPLGSFTFVSAQVPLSNRHRVMVFRALTANSDFVCVDDFIYKGFYPPAFSFTVEDGKLAYRDDKDNHLIRSIKLETPATAQ